MVIEGSKLGTVRPSRANYPPRQASSLLHLARGADPPVASPGQIKIVKVHGMHEGSASRRPGLRSEKRERNKRLTVRFLDTNMRFLRPGQTPPVWPPARTCGPAPSAAQGHGAAQPVARPGACRPGHCGVNKAGSNLNQIAHALNTGFQPEQAEVQQPPRP